MAVAAFRHLSLHSPSDHPSVCLCERMIEPNQLSLFWELRRHGDDTDTLRRAAVLIFRRAKWLLRILQDYKAKQFFQKSADVNLYTRQRRATCGGAFI